MPIDCDIDISYSNIYKCKSCKQAKNNISYIFKEVLRRYALGGLEVCALDTPAMRFEKKNLKVR